MRPKRKVLRPLVIHPKSALLPLVTDRGQTLIFSPGELLRMVRTKLRMSQEQLARRSGIEQAHIARMEADKVDAQWKTWQRLFEALGCRLALRIQADKGLEAIVEGRIAEMARRKVAWGERTFHPEKPLTEEERQAEIQEWIDMLNGRHTSEIWDEEES
jgi:transcriptional regulator with XRE-family HTH domain